MLFGIQICCLTRVSHQTPFALALYGCNATLSCRLYSDWEEKLGSCYYWHQCKHAPTHGCNWGGHALLSRCLRGDSRKTASGRGISWETLSWVLSTKINRIHRQLLPKVLLQLWAHPWEGMDTQAEGAVVLTHLSGAWDPGQLRMCYAIKFGWNWPKVVCGKTGRQTDSAVA